MNIKFFEDLNEKDIAGGKGLSLAKMYHNKFNIPNGFVIMANVFDNFLEENHIKEDIQKIINNSDIDNEKEIDENSNNIIEKISKCEISDDIKNEILENYKKLNCKYVAVRSSATSEDGKSHAWAGQLESFLNVDEITIIDRIKDCWSSLFSKRALFYRIKNNDTSNISVAVIVQTMIQSDVSGVAFSINPITNNLDEIVIESVLGLGEAIVSGKVTPDTYIVNKKENKLVKKEIKNQNIKLVKYNNKNEWMDEKQGNIQKLDNEEILELSNEIKKIEKFYGFPVDIEWAIEENNVYILQCRPITTLVNNNKLVEKIKNSGSWKFYVARKFN